MVREAQLFVTIGKAGCIWLGVRTELRKENIGNGMCFCLGTQLLYRAIVKREVIF